jgi:hypothetical protein
MTVSKVIGRSVRTAHGMRNTSTSRSNLSKDQWGRIY